MELQARSVLVSGCTHADAQWMLRHVLPCASEAKVEAVLVAGDFGYWRHSQDLLKIAASSQEKFGVDTWFIDGNHEEYPYLAAAVAQARAEQGTPIGEPVRLEGSLYYIPRGAHVRVGELTVVGLGGAASIDYLYRVPELDWFSEEELSDEDIERVRGGGVADVMISHDAPNGWLMPGLTPIEKMSKEWQARLPVCWAHQKRVREAYEAAMPKMLLHSHYHTGYETKVEEAWGEVAVVGLNCAEAKQWGRVLSSQGGEPVLGEWVSRGGR